MGPGSRISTVDCSRVLNVNKRLYSSTSRVERSEMFCERSEPACTRPRLVLLERLLFTFIVSTVVLLLEDSTGGYCRIRLMRLCVCSVGNLKILKTIKKHYKRHAPHGGWFTVVFKNMLQDSRILGF